MNEADWNSCTAPQALLAFLRDSGKLTERNLHRPGVDEVVLVVLAIEVVIGLAFLAIQLKLAQMDGGGGVLVDRLGRSGRSLRQPSFSFLPAPL